MTTPASLTWSGVIARRMDRSALSAVMDRGLAPGGQAGNYPVLLVDGVVGGVWYQRRRGRTLVGAVMEARPTLVVGPVTVGPHA